MTSDAPKLGTSQALLHALLGARNSTVALTDFASVCGYKASTLRTYLSKNMLFPFAALSASGKCVIGACEGLELRRLEKLLSQRRNRFAWEHLGATELVSDMLERSKTNASLALEIINRPSLANRIDAFVLLLVTSWEQLLKARLEYEDPGSIFTGERSASGRKKTISLTQAIERSYPSRTDVVRQNLETVKDLRDAAAHLLVPLAIGAVTRYFQAALNNYREFFRDLTGESPFKVDGTGLLTLGVPYESPSLEALTILHGAEQAFEIKALLTDLEQGIEQIGDDAFAVSFQHHLVLDKKASVGAIRLTNSSDGVPARLVKVARDPKTTHPYSTKECANPLREKTSHEWHMNHVAIVAKFLGVKRNDSNEFYYKIGNTRLYSDRFIERVVRRFQQEPRLVELAYAAMREKRE